MIQRAYERAAAGELLTKEELMLLSRQPLEALTKAANELRWETCGNGFDLCTITNAKSGRCSEDCKYCAQSACYQSEIETYSLVSQERIEKEAAYNWKKGVLRFSVVTSGKRLSDGEIDYMCRAYQEISRKYGIFLCASHGLLTEEQFSKLKAAGVSRYHNNLETSRNFFPSICSTHSYDEKIRALRLAQKAGLTLCSGGIIGMGETMEDRIDLILQLRDLGVRSIPVNVLNPIAGTPLEKQKPLSQGEVNRTIALFRFAIPHSSIRLAGGRGLFEDKGESCFLAGANAAISGDMLTTAGISIDTDLRTIQNLGFEVKKYG